MALSPMTELGQVTKILRGRGGQQGLPEELRREGLPLLVVLLQHSLHVAIRGVALLLGIVGLEADLLHLGAEVVHLLLQHRDDALPLDGGLLEDLRGTGGGGGERVQSPSPAVGEWPRTHYGCCAAVHLR